MPVQLILGVVTGAQYCRLRPGRSTWPVGRALQMLAVFIINENLPPQAAIFQPVPLGASLSAPAETEMRKQA